MGDNSIDPGARESSSSRQKRALLIKHIKTNDLTSQFDYVLVFPIKNENITKRTKLCVNQMNKAGMETFCYKSIQDDEVIVLVRCPIEKLKKFADEVDFQLELDPENVKNALKAGLPDPNKEGQYLIKPIEINEDPIYSSISPYDHLFGKYEEDHDQSLYYIPGNGIDESPFTKNIRLKLIYAMLRAPEYQGGCALEISKMLFNKKLLAIFPLHDHNEKQQLVDLTWQRSTFPWNAPIEDFRVYFGEKIALNMVFMGHYSKWLIVPGIIGMIFQLVVWATLDFSSPVLPFFSVIICIWGILMLEYWKRLENYTALHWGMTEYEKEEPDRPEFRGELIKSYITGKPSLYFPASAQFDNSITSGSVVWAFILLVLGVVTSIYVLRFSLSGQAGAFASTIASVLNTVQITVFNYIYSKVAVRLTDNENLRTDTEYEDSMIIKQFVFQFINSYTSFFFLAFIAQYLDKPSDAPDDYVGQCGANTCMQPLSINLAIIFGTRLIFKNFLDIFLPYMKHKKKFRDETKGVAEDKKITPAEQDYFLLVYDGALESINKYSDAAIQFGYSMLFVTALPCASFFSLVSNYYKVKFNAWKLCTFYQRPVPIGAQDIGTWMNIFQFIAVAGVITNAGLICFTQDTIPFSLSARLWIFIAFQWVLIFTQFVVSQTVPDEPEDYLVQLKRMEFIRSKLIDKTPDEAYDFEEDDDEGGEDNLRPSMFGGGAITRNPCGCLPCCKVFKYKNLRKKYQMNDLPDVKIEQFPAEGTGGVYTPDVTATPNPMQGQAAVPIEP